VVRVHGRRRDVEGTAPDLDTEVKVFIFKLYLSKMGKIIIIMIMQFM
jgi:hypothetical protein